MSTETDQGATGATTGLDPTGGLGSTSGRPLEHHATRAITTAGSGSKRGPRGGGLVSRSVLSVWFVLPALVIYLVFTIVPVISGTGLAFTQRTDLGSPLEFVGLDNFARVFTDQVALSSFGNTLILTAIACIVQNGLGLLLALALHRAFRSRTLLRTLFFAPAILSPLVIGYLWQYLFSTTGALNWVLGAVGLESWQRAWLGESSTAIWAVGFTIVWQLVGYSMVIYLAGLQGIPPEVNEAAQLDGATAFQRFRYVTFPLLAPANTICLTLSLIGGLKLFDQVIALTGGGPGYATETLATNVYKQSFIFGDDGYGAALAVILTIVVTVATLAQMWILKRREQH